MPTSPPIPPAARSPFGPEGAPKPLEDVSHRVRQAAERHGRQQSAAATAWRRPEAASVHPLLKVAAAAFVGYALGTIFHGRAAPPPPPPPPPRPRAPARRAASFRAPMDGEARSPIRFR